MDATILAATATVSVLCALHGKDGPAVVSFITGAYYLKSMIDRNRMNQVVDVLKDMSGDLKRISSNNPDSP